MAAPPGHFGRKSANFRPKWQIFGQFSAIFGQIWPQNEFFGPPPLMTTPRPTAHYGRPHPAILAENRPIFGQNGRFLTNFQLFLAKFSLKMSFLARPHS
jgi:hypothetical protein